MTETSHCLFEVSWEVCNKVGGIYTVIREQAPRSDPDLRGELLPPRPGPQDQPRFRGNGRGVLEPDPGRGGDQGDPLPLRPLEGPRRAQGRSSSASGRSTTRISSSSGSGRTTASIPSPGDGITWSRSCSATPASEVIETIHNLLVRPQGMQKPSRSFTNG